MRHIFDGNWAHSELDKRNPPEHPTPKREFSLAIDDKGNFDLDLTEVDGRQITRGVVNDVEHSIELWAKDGRHYKGWVVRHYLDLGKLHLVMAGRYKDPPPLPPNAKAGGTKPAANAQNEGDWVITKP